jgi:CheY-like chemotaxis protein
MIAKVWLLYTTKHPLSKATGAWRRAIVSLSAFRRNSRIHQRSRGASAMRWVYRQQHSDTLLRAGMNIGEQEDVTGMIRLLLVDDLAVVRSGLRMRLALEQDMKVIGEADDGALALDLARELRPDIVLMDAEMPRMDGIAATIALRAAMAQVIVIILGLNEDKASRERALAAGAAAFVSKRTADTALIGAIRRAAIEHGIAAA